MKSNFDDEKYLLQALQGSPEQTEKALKWLCRSTSWRSAVGRLVQDLGGSEADSEDTFQEGLVIFIKNVRDKKFENRSQLMTYFLGICRNVYLQQFGNRRAHSLGEQPDLEEPPRESQIVEDERQATVVRLYKRVLDNLGDTCRQVIELVKLRYSMEEIAAAMAYTNVQSAKNQALRCREKMRNFIIETPGLREQIKSVL